jgi:hypothetical protein
MYHLLTIYMHCISKCKRCKGLKDSIPIWRRVKEKTKDVAVQSEGFVRLYDQMSPEPSVEVFQHSFDYSFLGTKMASSSLTNLSITTVEIKNTSPEAVFDDRLKEVFGVYMPLATQGDEIEINCKLIYLCHKAASGLDPSV